jgi:hypothetical protein
VVRAEAVKPSEANEAKVEVEAQPEQGLKPPVEGNVSEAPKANASSSTPVVTEASSTDSPPKVESNQGSQVEPSVGKPEATGAHWSGGMATIKVGAYINHKDSPIEAIAIRRSTIGAEAIEAPVRLATVDAAARGLCKTDECLVSARLAVIFTLNTVRTGPVRLRWLEREFKSRYPSHYEALRESGITILNIVAALRGLGVVTIGDIVAPGGWHPRWLAGLVKGALEAKGAATVSELMQLIRNHERDLPSEFEGGLVLSDLIALTVRFLEWSSAVKVEGGVITLIK